MDLAPLTLGAKVQAGETMGSLNARVPADPTLAGLVEGDLQARADLAVYQEFAGQPAASPLELERASAGLLHTPRPSGNGVLRLPPKALRL